MKNTFIIIFILISLLFFSCQQNNNVRHNIISIELNQNWLFHKIGDSVWYRASVPGTVHTDLLDNGLIEDPFFGINEHDLQWIDKADWEYKTHFSVEADILNKSDVFIDFKGLDTYADVYLNGHLILTADNMFRSWKVYCRDQLHPGENELRVLFKSPVRIGIEKLAKQGYPLPASNDQSENGEVRNQKVSVFTRKAPYHFGWDWGPRLVTSGIWRPVELFAFDNIKIDNVHLVQKKVTNSVAGLIASINLNCISPGAYQIQVDVNDQQNIAKSVILKKGLQNIKLGFTIKNPKLWWPNGIGDQNLYDIGIKIIGKRVEDSEVIRTGLRTLRLVQQPDKNGKSFFFDVNGVPVFAKGANYIPNDVFLPRVQPGNYERIVKAAADANMNMLRVWGGGIYENDLFYDLCDEYGIMVWQDFMFACSMYPGDTAFLNNTRKEAEENIRRLRNHPCLALWCGNNEIEVAWAENVKGKGWGWKERYTPELRHKIWHDYDTLFHQILPDAVQRLNPQTTYWPSSPSATGDKLATYESTSGDMHYWGVWHGLQPFTNFRKYRARFMSEYGFQSFPELNTVKTYAMPEEWNIESKVMASHQRSGIGNLRIRQYMEQDYKIPDNFEQFLYVSQLLQAEGIKVAIEAHRSERPYCMGSLYWQLNDCWPVASWSGIDYYGRWKALQYFVKKAFQPEIIVIFQDTDSLEIRVVSDKPVDQYATIRLLLSDFSGNILWQNNFDFNLKANASALINKIGLHQYNKFGSTDQFVLISKLIIGEKEVYNDSHYFVKPKYLKLSDPKLTYTVSEIDDHFLIIIQVNKLAKNVFFTTDVSTDHFSDNFFDLLPGTNKEITFPKVTDLKSFQKSLSVNHLQQTMQ